MALETGTYISDLVSTNPASSDNISQGDDHIRLLKSTIKATFPNITGAVTPTQADLNKLTSSGSPQFSTIELGAASDTTISRVSAGLIAVEGGNVPLENRANTFTANQVISVTDNTNAALRVTQLGTGNALVVEDSANPDSTPFVVNANGQVGIGAAPEGTIQLDVAANVSYNARFKGTLNNYLGAQIYNQSSGSSACSFLQFGTDALGYASYIGHNSSTSTQPGGANALTLYQTLNAPMVMYTNSTERMRIEAGGTISIANATMPWSGGGNVVMPDSSTLSFNGTTGHFSTNLYYSGTWRNGSNAAGALYVQGNGQHVWYNAPAAAAGTAAGLSERMRLQDGNLSTVGSGQHILTIQAGSAYSGLEQNALSSGVCYQFFKVNSVEKGRILVDGSGNYVIYAGTGSFMVSGTGLLYTSATYANTTGSAANMFIGSGGYIARSTSSIKYKKDVENLDTALVDNAIANLRPVWYRSKEANGDDKLEWSHIGLIAEEVDQVEPRLVQYKTVDLETVDDPLLDAEGNPVLDDNGQPIINRKTVEHVREVPEPENVDYARLSVILLDKVQRMDATIKALEARIAALEAA